MKDDIFRIRRIVAKWANEKCIVQNVRFFGSRTREKHNIDSDLDIAVTLIYSEPDVSLAYWFSVEDDWRNELSEIVRWKIDLQFYHPEFSQIVAKGIDRSSMFVYEQITPV